MCVITEEGIKLSNGKKITFDNPDMSQLTKEELTEISSTPMMILGAFYLHKDLRELKNNVDRMTRKLDANLKELKLHTSGCPINENAIKQIAREEIINSKEVNRHLEERWWTIFKDKVINAGTISKAILAIMMLLGLFSVLSELIRGKL